MCSRSSAGPGGWRKEAQETRDLSDGLREKFSNCQRTTTSETDKFRDGFWRLRYPVVLVPYRLASLYILSPLSAKKAWKDARRNAIYSRFDLLGHPLALRKKVYTSSDGSPCSFSSFSIIHGAFPALQIR